MAMGFGLLAVLFWLFAVVPVYKVIKPDPESMGLNPDGDESNQLGRTEAKEKCSSETSPSLKGSLVSWNWFSLLMVFHSGLE